MLSGAKHLLFLTEKEPNSRSFAPLRITPIVGVPSRRQMKKPLIALVAFVVIAFTLIAVFRRRTVDRLEVSEGPASAKKQRIRNFWGLYNKANTLRLQGAYAEAAVAYQECLRLNPKHEDSLYYLGSCFEELGNYNEAASTYRKLIIVNPSSGRACSELGNTLSGYR
jgi:tetratricopeptide (TPR) repeat protein